MLTENEAVNFYKHHIGDYAKKTGHLSLLEHGAYLVMLHAYYGTEKPLPLGEQLYRITRAQSKAERAAVDSIARQFWEQTDTGLVNGRAFVEMEEATRQADASRQNGNLGGRPKKTHQVSETEPRTQPNNNLLQTPDSTIQNNTAPSAVPDKVKSKPKILIPPDFQLSEAMRDRALRKLPDVDVDEMFVQFRAHHEAHGKAMKSWDAAWTTWLGNAHQFGYPRTKNGGAINWR